MSGLLSRETFAKSLREKGVQNVKQSQALNLPLSAVNPMCFSTEEEERERERKTNYSASCTFVSPFDEGG